MDAELQKLLDSAGLSAEQRAEAEKAFSIEGLGKVVRDGVLMRADYSRKMDELAATRKTLEANWEKANSEYVEMVSSLEATRAEKEEAARKLQEAEGKLAAAQSLPKIEPIDTSKFLTVEQIAEREKKFAAGQTAFFGDTLEAVDLIQSLTGTKVKARDLLKESVAANKSPLEYAEEKYQLSQKQQEAEASRRAKELEDARADERSKVLAEMANPATRPMAESRQPFYVPKPGADGEAVNPWDLTEMPADEVQLLKELQAARQ